MRLSPRKYLPPIISALCLICAVKTSQASIELKHDATLGLDCSHLLGEWEGRYNLLDQGMHVDWHWYWWDDNHFEGEIYYTTGQETTVEFLAGVWSCDGNSYTNETHFSSQVLLDDTGPWEVRFYFEELTHSYMRTRAEIDEGQWEIFEAIKIGK